MREEFSGLQAAADAKGAADAQITWLRANMGAYFSRKLLSVVRRIERHVGAHDDDPGHQFPRLAGSYLSDVSLASPPRRFIEMHHGKSKRGALKCWQWCYVMVHGELAAQNITTLVTALSLRCAQHLRL